MHIHNILLMHQIKLHTTFYGKHFIVKRLLDFAIFSAWEPVYYLPIMSKLEYLFI